MSKHDTVQVPAGHGLMAIPDHTGHTAVLWNHDNPAQVEETRTRFDEIIRAGYRAYESEPGNAQESVVIHKFNPAAERITFFRQLAGG